MSLSTTTAGWMRAVRGSEEPGSTVVSVSLADSGSLCHSYSYGLRAIIQCLPAWFRFIQCLRRYRDTKRAFPHLVNAGKYSTTFFVVTFAALYATHRGKTSPWTWSGLRVSDQNMQLSVSEAA